MSEQSRPILGSSELMENIQVEKKKNSKPGILETCTSQCAMAHQTVGKKHLVVLPNETTSFNWNFQRESLTRHPVYCCTDQVPNMLVTSQLPLSPKRNLFSPTVLSRSIYKHFQKSNLQSQNPFNLQDQK